MHQVLQEALVCNHFSKLGIYQTEFLLNNYQIADSEIFCALILALSYKMDRGDICLLLDKRSISSIINDFTDMEKKSLMFSAYNKYHKIVKYLKALLDIDRVQKLILQSSCISDKLEDNLPLIYANNRLYFSRYYHYEGIVCDFINQNEDQAYDANILDKLKHALSHLYKDEQDTVNWQKLGVILALKRRFSIISGGPGTGKTTTVLKLLLLLCALDQQRHQIILCAPTGKAAARMSESILGQLSKDSFLQQAKALADEFAISDYKKLILTIPTQAHTIHSILKVVPHKVEPVFNEHNKIKADIIVVDEVSMVDLALFSKFIKAIDKNTIVIMLGDKDQLCSVEAGSVLGDLCANLNPRENNIKPDTLDFLANLSDCRVDDILTGQLNDNVLVLQKSYRFNEKSGIGKLANLVNYQYQKPSNLDEFIQICKQNDDLSLQLIEANSEYQILKAKVQELAFSFVEKTDVPSFYEYLDYLYKNDFTLDEQMAAKAFLLLDSFRVLCSNRSGILGCSSLNKLIESNIKQRYKFDNKYFFPGKVILINQNDPGVNLHNGDVGFCAYDKEDGVLKVFFIGPEQNQIIKINPIFLKSYESGFAMTVHKSQGSEYLHVFFALSTSLNSVLSKELVYTAITRAKQKFSMIADKVVLKGAISQPVLRQSGLAIRLQN